MAPFKKRLLVVDDEDAIRESLVIGLGDYGWDVTEAANSSSALDFDTPFDVYLIDLSLPDDNGIELAQTLGKRFGAIPIVLLTGYLNSGIEDEAKEGNISVIVKKPFRFEELDQVLKNLCEPKKPV